MSGSQAGRRRSSSTRMTERTYLKDQPDIRFLVLLLLCLCKSFKELFLDGPRTSNDRNPAGNAFPKSECKGKHFFRNTKLYRQKNHEKTTRKNTLLIYVKRKNKKTLYYYIYKQPSLIPEGKGPSHPLCNKKKEKAQIVHHFFLKMGILYYLCKTITFIYYDTRRENKHRGAHC